jgi:hypothetical protein
MRLKFLKIRQIGLLRFLETRKNKIIFCIRDIFENHTPGFFMENGKKWYIISYCLTGLGRFSPTKS